MPILWTIRFVRKEVCQRHEGIHHPSPANHSPPSNSSTAPASVNPNSPSSTAPPNANHHSPGQHSSGHQSPSAPITLSSDTSQAIAAASPVLASDVWDDVHYNDPIPQNAPILSTTSQYVNAFPLVNPVPTTDDALHSNDWPSVAQTSDFLFDQQVYGWLEQVLMEQSQNGMAVNLPPAPEVYFPPPMSTSGPSEQLDRRNYPVLGEGLRSSLIQMWQGLSIMRGVILADDPGLPLHFATGWQIILIRFPIVHAPSFDILTAPASFLSSVIALGAVHSLSEPDRAFAKQLLPIIRSMTVSVSGIP
uniref:Transcription factor domain-containing protein n=1 Tax=Kwoniella dejecticola CBS 10117 TaxID=1296121 RepID=A0A1A6A654_9TREE|nr:uncharacterized protein I303_04877 [Kwoniella dejecticola CBS 10117]OBR85541.1 hypothetical protein I303_04877 [Kwoniella dejecticola CBS 10117]